jgi:hypothetical protein
MSSRHVSFEILLPESADADAFEEFMTGSYLPATIRRSQPASRVSAPLPGGSAPIASAYHRTATCHWLEGMVKGGVMRSCEKHGPPDRHF